MNFYEISVKSNKGLGASIPVKIISNKIISDPILKFLETKELDDARKYCQTVLKATFVII